MATKQKIEWVDEKEAAAMLHMKPLYFRDQVKAGRLKGVIHYSQLHRRAIIYVKQDIENYIYDKSTLV